MTINIDIFTKDLELTDHINDYVMKKVPKLEKFLNDIDDCRVDLAYVKSARNASDRNVAQLTIRGKGFILRAEERSDNLFEAIDNALEKMRRQVDRFKGKHYHGRGIQEEADLEPLEDMEPDEMPVIARRKRFQLVPMDENEAIEQMQLLGHEDFFVFYNANTSEVNILYRRRDGTYGLIEPSVG